jgi:SAM-dependent methyltransferase
VWNWIDPLVRPGDAILDVGCGTGEDALHLMSRGAKVYATDASPAMVRVARAKGVDAHVMRAECLVSISHTAGAGMSARATVVDGVISNFGALNCIEELDKVASALGHLIRSGGFLAICVIGRCCAWEIVHYLLRAQPQNAFRRFSSHTQSSIGVLVKYPTVMRLARIFHENFKLVHWCGIGLCVPPSYVTGLRDGTIARLAKLDRHLAHLPLLRAIADHRLLLFRRI